MNRALSALVPERMVERAYERLYESVNSGRLIAFVGSGASRVYGYPGWTEFVRAVVARLKLDAEDLQKLHPKSSLICRVLAEMPAIASPDDEGVIILEFVNQAYRTLAGISRDAKRYDFGRVLQEIFGEARSVAVATAPLLELAGIVTSIVEKDALTGAETKRVVPLAAALHRPLRDVRGLEPLLGNTSKSDEIVADAIYRIAPQLYHMQTLKNLAKKRRPRAAWLEKLAWQLEIESKRQRRGVKLAIDRRSIMAVFLAASVLGDNGNVNFRSVLPKPDNPGPMPRPLLDPLRGLADHLLIRRYFTTNYDFELENLFMFDDIRERDRTAITEATREKLYDRPDFTRSEEDGAITRHRPDGIRVRSDVNDGKHTAPLEEFGLGASDGSIHIYHHHGRIDLPKSLIAADGEYNRMYRTDDGTRISLEHAYDSMIEGNPILFVGSGLTEMELNRTLRRRVSNRKGPNDSPMFVLREAKDLPQKLMREQLTLATKLDVQVIHFGHPRRGRGFSLREQLLLVDHLAEMFLPKAETGFDNEGRPKLDPPADVQWTRQIPDATKEECENLRAALCAPTVAEEVYVRRRRLKHLLKNRFSLIADLDFDNRTVEWLVDQPDFAKAVALRLAARGVDGKAKDSQAQRAAKLMFKYFEELTVRLRTAALRHELRQIGREAHSYFNRKARTPDSRICGTICPVKSEAIVPDRWSRHLFVDRISQFDRAKKARKEIRREPKWYWTVVRPKPEADIGLKGFEKLRQNIAAVHSGEPGKKPEPWLRNVIIGDRGTGKGKFLRDLRAHLRKAVKPKRWLILNCAYGMEVDSLVAIVSGFLKTLSTDRPKNAPRRTRRELMLEAKFSGERPLLVLGAVDRLFGIDSRPLGAEFEWLLEYLTSPESPIDLVITASRRCLPYFQKLAKRRRAEGKAKLSQRSDESSEAVKPIKGGKAGKPGKVTAPPANYSPIIYRVYTVYPPVKGEAKGTTRGVAHRETDEWVGTGLLRRLVEHQAPLDDKFSGQDSENARLRMRHDRRREEDIVGRVIEGLVKPPDGLAPGVGRLAQEMLKTLAFVSVPIEAEVLISTPGVRRELMRLRDGSAEAPGGDPLSSAEELLRGYSTARITGEDKADIRTAFLCALQLLMDRDLIDLIEPHGCLDAKCGPVVTPEEAVASRYRFTLHRLVSLVIRGRFGLPVAETVVSDTFNLSLYAAQPDDAPIFSPEIINDLEQMVDHLLHAWHDVTLNPELATMIAELRTALLDESLYSTNALAPDLLMRLYRYEQRIRMLDPLVPGALRAAGGLIRGFFSSANLLGLDIKDPSSRNSGFSVLTAHKQRIRALLDMALGAQSIRIALRDRSKPVGFVGPAGRFAPLDTIFEVKVLVSKGGQRNTPTRQMTELSRTPEHPENWQGEAGERALRKWHSLRGSVTARGPELWFRTTEPTFNRLDTILAGQAPQPGSPLALFQTYPLHREEIIWLLNERAMLSLAQGDLYSAGTTFQLAVDALRDIEGTRYQPMQCRLIINRALLRIERGQIAEARRWLEELNAGVGASADALTRESREGRLVLGLATGYLGLCDQLNGLVRRAEGQYREALKVLSELREQRAVAIFEFHLGSLLQTDSGRRDEAAACYHRAVSAAEGGRHTDILYRIRVAQAHNNRLRGSITTGEAQEILRRSIEYGTRLDIHRVTVEALSASAQLRLGLGDIEASSEDAARAMSLASQYGMTLRRVWLRAMSGKIFRARGDFDNARYMFERAIEAAERTGFHRAVEDASQQLMSMRPR